MKVLEWIAFAHEQRLQNRPARLKPNPSDKAVVGVSIAIFAMLAGIAVEHVGALKWWHLAIVVIIGCVTLANAQSDNARGLAFYLLLIISPMTALGGIIMGVDGALLGVGAAFLMIVWIEEVGHTKMMSILTLGYKFGRSLEHMILSPFSWLLLGLTRHFPIKKQQFVSSAIDAFLLKRSAQGLEFRHRLVRDYFAMRDLMPHLEGGASTRHATIRALGFQGESALDTLSDFVQQGTAEERAAAISALSHIPSETTTRHIKFLTIDLDLLVRVEVLKAARKQKLETADTIWDMTKPIGSVEETEVALDTHFICGAREDMLDRSREARYLDRMGEMAPKALIQIAKTKDRWLSHRAIEMFPLFRTDNIFHALVDLSKSADGSTLVGVVAAASNMVDSRAEGVLNMLANNSSIVVRGSAQDGLLKLNSHILALRDSEPHDDFRKKPRYVF